MIDVVVRPKNSSCHVYVARGKPELSVPNWIGIGHLTSDRNQGILLDILTVRFVSAKLEIPPKTATVSAYRHMLLHHIIGNVALEW